MKVSIPMNISARIESRLGLSTWLTLPVTETKLKTALEKVYSYTDDYAVTGFVSTYPGITAAMLEGAPLSLINYLAARLNKLDEWGLEQLSAFMQSDMRPKNTEEMLEYLQNESCYMFDPGIKTVEQLGRYYLYDSCLVDMPRLWRDAVCPVVFGMNVAKLEGGTFTSRGYIARFRTAKRKKAISADNIPETYRLPEPTTIVTPTRSYTLAGEEGEKL